MSPFYTEIAAVLTTYVIVEAVIVAFIAVRLLGRTEGRSAEG